MNRRDFLKLIGASLPTAAIARLLPGRKEEPNERATEPQPEQTTNFIPGYYLVSASIRFDDPNQWGKMEMIRKSFPDPLAVSQGQGGVVLSAITRVDFGDEILVKTYCDSGAELLEPHLMRLT